MKKKDINVNAKWTKKNLTGTKSPLPDKLKVLQGKRWDKLSHQVKFQFGGMKAFIEILNLALKNYMSNYACGIDIGGEDVSEECKKAKEDFSNADGVLEEMPLQGGFSKKK